MGTLFKLLRIIGDAKAISKGTIHKRLVRRAGHRRINKWGR